MTDVPEAKYAPTSEEYVACQLLGEGPIDVGNGEVEVLNSAARHLQPVSHAEPPLPAEPTALPDTVDESEHLNLWRVSDTSIAYRSERLCVASVREEGVPRSGTKWHKSIS